MSKTFRKFPHPEPETPMRGVPLQRVCMLTREAGGGPSQIVGERELCGHKFSFELLAD